MSTEAQINANRLNAQKSTGPKSPEGKAASSLNALKSGIDAWSHIIPGEAPAELEALTAEFLLHYRPAGPTELSLVDTLISTEWIQRRLRCIEAQLWNYQVECLDKNLTHADFIDAAIQHNSPLGHAYQDALEPFSRIQRRIDATNRMFLRTLKALQDLQAVAVSDGPSPLPTQPLAPQIGFVPESTPEPGEPHAPRENPAAPPDIHHTVRVPESSLRNSTAALDPLDHPQKRVPFGRCGGLQSCRLERRQSTVYLRRELLSRRRQGHDEGTTVA